MTISLTSSPNDGEPTHSPILISLVGIICAIFLLFIYYSILKRHSSLFGGPPFRDRTQTRLLIEHNPAEDNTPLHFESRGLDFAVVHSLPSIQFRKCDEESGQGSTDCTVCLGEFEEGERLRLLPNCAHIFHVSCIDTWFRTHSTCPLCRSDVLLDFHSQHGHSLSIFTLMETLRREDAYRESSYGYNILGCETMQNSAGWCRPTYSDRFGSESEESVSTVSSPPATNDHQTADFQHKQDHTLREGSSSRDGCH